MSRNPDETFSISLVDRSGELTRIQFAPSAAFMANALAEHPPEGSVAHTFFASLGELIDGKQLRRSATVTRKVDNAAFAPAGQREERWLVIYHDNQTLTLYSLELPCRKSGLQPPFNQDEVDLTAEPFASFKAAAEQAIVSPLGNAITILSIRLIGRNV